MHKCEICDKEFSYAKNLKVHINKVHEGLKHRTCDQCDYVFSNSKDLKKHINSNHYYYDFENDSELAENLQSNNLDKNPGQKLDPVDTSKDAKASNITKKVYENNSELGEILLLKLDPINTAKDHNCEVCKQDFSSAQNLKLHIESVHEELKNHKCDKCDKAFSERVHLMIHDAYKH